MFESSKLHCRLHCLGVEVTNGYRGHVFRLGPCFFFPFHKPNYYECAFFLAKPTTHARVVRHTILKRNGKKKPWAQTNNSLPNNHVRHNEASFNSTKWRCPYDNVTYCKFTPNRKQLPKQLPPPLHMARTWMDMHRLRRLHDSQYIMKNPFTNENSNLSNIFHNNIHRKKVESLKVRSTEEFLCQFAWLPCRFFRGRRQGRQPLNKYGCILCFRSPASLTLDQPAVAQLFLRSGWTKWLCAGWALGPRCATGPSRVRFFLAPPPHEMLHDAIGLHASRERDIYIYTLCICLRMLANVQIHM